MAEQSGFFDAHLVNGEYDRVYLAEHFAKYFASFIGNGIFGGKSNELMVRENEAPNMSVRVLSGQAWIDGYWYENDDEYPLTIDIADGVLHRIDSIVVRWNHSQRTIRLAIKKGVAATNPVAPIVQRDDDYYELKLADIYIKAGTTKITQSSITDKRYNSDECGFVIGVVQQLDTEEFGIQLDTYIKEFIAEHNAWKNATVSEINSWVNTFKSSLTNWFNTLQADTNTSVSNLLTTNQARIDKLISDGQTNINNVASAGETKLNKTASDGAANINKLVSDKTAEIDTVIADAQQRFDNVIDDLEEIAKSNDVASLVLDVNALKTDVSILKSDNTNTEESVQTLKSDVSTLKSDNTVIKKDIEDLKKKVEEPNGMGIEDEVETGCYYVEAADGSKEWINPPNKPGIEYRMTERWNGSPVYQKVLYAASLPNKTLAGIHIEAHYQKIIHVSGFAIDNENNMHYPFPIVQNGLTPIAIIQGVESDGGDESDIVIQTNENISHMTGYVTVKYTK